MATLTQNIYNILTQELSLSVPNIYAGFAKGDTSARDGLLTYFLLPSPGTDFASGTTNSQYQFDIWHQDIYEAEAYKEELVKALSGTAGWYDGKPLIFSMISDLGGLYEDEGNVWHYPTIFNIKWVR